MGVKILCIGFEKNYIKFAQIDASYKKDTLTHLSFLDIPENSSEDVGYLIGSYIKDNDLISNQYVAVFNASECFVRHLSFPFKSKDKIKQVIREEIELDLPVSIEGMAVDFAIGEKLNNNQYSVVAFACREEKIENILSILKTAQVDPDFIIPDIYAIDGIASFCKTGRVFVDVKDDRINYYQRCKDNNLFLRSIHVLPEKNIFSSLMSAEFKADNIFGDCGYDIVVVDSKDEEIKENLKNSYDCDVLGIDEYFNQFMDLEINGFDIRSYADVLGAIILTKHKNDIVNFRKGKFKKTTKIEKIKQPLTYAIASLNIIMLSFVFYQYSEYMLFKKEISKAKNNIETVLKRNFKHIPKNLSTMQYKSLFLGKIQELKNNNTTVSVSKYTFIEILNAIHRSIPKNVDIKVNGITYDGNGVVISGKADSYDVVDRAKNLLSKNGIFESVDIRRATTQSSKGVIFDLFAKLKKE